MSDSNDTRGSFTGFRVVDAYGATREELLTEIGVLHMQATRLNEIIAPLERLSLWIKKQALIATPEVCCPGMELESRIVELIAKGELNGSKR